MRLMQLVAVLAFWAMLTACSQNDVFDGVTETKRGDVVVTVVADGQIVLPIAVDLSFNVAGTVAEVLVEDGDTVAAGQLLVRLDIAGFKVKITRAEASVANARDALSAVLEPPSDLDLELAQATVSGASEDLANAKDAFAVVGPAQTKLTEDAAIKLEEATGAYAFLLRRYYGIVPGPKEALDSPSSIYERRGNPGLLEFWTTLFPEELNLDDVAVEIEQGWGAARQANLDHEAVLVRKSQAVTTAAEVVTKAKAALEAAKEALDSLQSGPDPTVVLTKEAALASSEQTLDEARDKLANVTLTSPVDGVVTALAVEPKDTVKATEIVLVIVDPSFLEVTAFVDQLDVLLVQPGQQVSITVAAAPKVALPGQVRDLGLLSQTHRGIVRYPVTIDLVSDLELSFREGMGVTAVIEVERKEDVVVVPVGALRTDGIRQAVQVVADDGLTDTQFVTVGSADAFYAEITGGVREGVRVVDFSVAVGQSEFLQRPRPHR